MKSAPILTAQKKKNLGCAHLEMCSIALESDFIWTKPSLGVGGGKARKAECSEPSRECGVCGGSHDLATQPTTLI